MDLIKFTSQLGGKDPTASPFRIPAKDLDGNFAKLKPLPTDGNARQYAIEETPDGWFLRLFPEAPGLIDSLQAQPAIPAPPTTGTYVLGSINGVVHWLETEAC